MLRVNVKRVENFIEARSILKLRMLKTFVDTTQIFKVIETNLYLLCINQKLRGYYTSMYKQSTSG